MSKPRKWIQQEIKNLDPEEDYERIWKLSISYKMDDFVMNLFYASAFPNIIAPEQAARPVWREDGGKVLHKATHRARQTGNFVAIVSWYGPSHPKTRRAIEHVNSLHRHWTKNYTGDFTDVDDYIYTLCTFALVQERILGTLGLPGLSEKEKIAAHLFWREISKQFYMEEEKPIPHFPGSWDEIVTYMENIENTRVPATKQASLIAEAFFDQFAFRFFPPGLRWLGRALAISLCLPSTLEALRIQPVNGFFVWFLRRCAAMYLTVMLVWLPDPKRSYWEVEDGKPQSEKILQDKKAADLDKAFIKYFSRRHYAAIKDAEGSC